MLRHQCESDIKDSDDEGPAPKQIQNPKVSHEYNVSNHCLQRMMADLVRQFANLRLKTSPITRLPMEMLIKIFENLADPLATDHPPLTVTPRQDLRNLCQTSRQLNAAAATVLYRSVYLATGKSVGCFLFTLRRCPGLALLVKGVFGPSLSGPPPRLAYAFWDFGDTTHNAILSRNKFWEDPLPSEYFTRVPDRISGNMIMDIVDYLPHLHALTLPQGQLLNGPYTRQRPLPELKKLRISVVDQPEASFDRCPEAYCRRLVAWLNPSLIGARFPSLELLEIITPTGRWVAKLVPGDHVKPAKGHSANPQRYIESLTTTRTSPWGPAEWDLASLEQPVFDPSKFHTLVFAGPGKDCEESCKYVPTRNWNLNRFLLTTGRGLRTLSLDWEWIHDGWYFDQQMRLTTLHRLKHLTHLTISLQALFGESTDFAMRAWEVYGNPAGELARILPEPLRVLRISEFIFGNEGDDDVIRMHNAAVHCFLWTLRGHWLTARKGRQLWFRREAVMDEHYLAKRDATRGHLRSFLRVHSDEDIGGDFALVLPQGGPGRVTEQGES